MEELATKYHAAQFRNKNENIPYTEHTFGVASILVSAFELTHECSDPSLIEDMKNAGIGHDLIEDTEVTEEEIVAVSNERTLGYIRELSNPVDDAHTDEYMEQLRNATEEARLVKYCDLIENTTSVCYALQALGMDWANNFYLPILTRSTAVLAETTFERYPNTAKFMRDMLYVSSHLLETRMKNFKG